MSFRLRRAAEEDVAAITVMIAENNPIAARRWLNAIFSCCRDLGDMPGMGSARPEVHPDLRLYPVGNYLILYRKAEFGADIMRVIHGARHWQDLL
ncbi:type II toxin-antitoxin system RelE/ParE family toxin [Tistrella bauzanensis]|uniref:type II toxin-antitoxin system RelE/ParE family toxin n=1 Tax=Tistrella TaxID=171436 RepID=UPI0031F61EF7